MRFFRLAGLMLATLFIAAPTFALAADTSKVQIVNKRTEHLLVSYSEASQITWGAGCTEVAHGAVIAAGKTCTATVADDNASTRFCATDVTSVAAAHKVRLDCSKAQNGNLTMVETIFQPSTAGGCFNKGTCVWYDISIIPLNCTDALWKQNKCANAGGASYNLPVSLGCGGETFYVCQGPVSTKYGAAMYPSNCGNPNSKTQGGKTGQNAYFYPMFYPPEKYYQPNRACLGGATLVVTFLAGK
jgi:hypothetical protein